MKQGGTAGEVLEFYPSLTDREYLSGTFFYSSLTSTKLYCGKTLIIVDKEDENEKSCDYRCRTCRLDKDKAHAQALDIADSVSFCERETVVRDGDYKDCEDAALVVVAIGEARKPGQTRLDMLGRSVEMLKELLEQLKPYKIPGIVVTITNPADIVADYVRKGLGLERNRVFGTGTLLDTARLIRTLSEESGVGRRSIQAYSLGEHGDSSMIPFSSVTIGGLPFDAYDISKEKVLEATRQIGMTIIEGKKSTEFGIGRALTEMSACILRYEK